MQNDTNDTTRHTTSHPSDDELVLHYYDESDRRETLAAHLDQCADCRARYVTLQRVMATAQAGAEPQPPASFEDDLWARLQPVVATRPHWSPARLATPRRLMFGIGSALAAGLVLTFTLRGPAPTSPTERRVPARVGLDPRLLGDLDLHLDRASRLLVEVGNTIGPDDLRRVQVDAEDLVVSNRLYRSAAGGGDDPALRAVLDDLDRALVELARAPLDLTPDDGARLRARLDPDMLLFKLRVAAATVREQAAATRSTLTESERPS